MINRDEQLLAFRPFIVIDKTKESLNLECFQNETLRPILKFQNELILALFRAEVVKADFPASYNEKLLFLEKNTQKNHTFKQLLLGIVIGFFNTSELDFYLRHKSEVNKRMMQLIMKRVSDQIDVL
jgi:hypothetical protein